jgi:NAD(P)-dependent dehydrogenase (short-subunit alcohol dehydrogenase family)
MVNVYVGEFLMKYSKRIVLVTAGASGIGREIAQSFLASGDSVHVCDISEEAIADFLTANPRATATRCDVADSGQVDFLFDDIVARYGGLDILINNAGVAGPTARVEDVSPSDWDSTIGVDLNGVFYCTRRAVPLIKQVKGCIINMSSNAGFFGFPLRSPYTAAKWALIGLTKTWAMELGPDGVRVNAICPGSVNGPRIENVIKRDAQERGVSSESIRDIYQRQSSMRAFVDAQDIAATIQFLCSPAGKHISGQALAIDGHTEGLSNWLD